MPTTGTHSAVNLMSNDSYLLYQPREMMEENKAHFRIIFRQFVARRLFNPELFPPSAMGEPQP
jgi:hypothetical protein